MNDSAEQGCLDGGVYRYRTTVPSKAIDLLGHANNTAYVRWIQDAAVKHSAQLGMPWEWYVARREAFVIRRQTIDYLRPLREGDAIEVATWVATISQTSSTRKTEIKTVDGEPVLTAETIWIYVSLETGRPVRMPDEVRKAFAPVQASR